jgi:putative hemolysin
VDPDSYYIKLILLALFLILSAFFSAAETAFISLSKLHIRNMIDNGVKYADYVKKFSDSPQKLLSTILIGNNLVNISASSVATSIAISISGDRAYVLLLCTSLITILILVFSEITPKHIANRFPEKITLMMIKPIYFFYKFLSPLVFILNKISDYIALLFNGKNNHIQPVITESDLKTIVDVSHEEGVLEIDEREMINNVFEFKESFAKDVMIPRTDVIAVEDNSTYDEITEIFKTESFSRIPVYHDSIDDVVGILHLKDFIFLSKRNNFNINQLLRKPFFTYEFKPTKDLFNIMRLKRIPMAIIMDEYGGTAGIITLEDLVEEIVGDISDEYDDLQKQIDFVRENEYLIDGSTKLQDVNDELNIDLESNDFESIGGYLVGILGYFPKVHEVIDMDNFKFIIEEAGKNRIDRVRIIIKKK